MSDVLLDVESALTAAQRRSAYARFVGPNPSFAGAYWADILEHLVETDAHQLFLDSLWDEHLDEMTPDTAPFYNAAFLSLMYAEGQPPTHEEVMDLVAKASTIAAAPEESP